MVSLLRKIVPNDTELRKLYGIAPAPYHHVTLIRKRVQGAAVGVRGTGTNRGLQWLWSSG